MLRGIINWSVASWSVVPRTDRRWWPFGSEPTRCNACYNGGWKTSQSQTFLPQASTRKLSTPDFSIMNFSAPHFSIMNFSTPWLKTLWLKSPVLKSLWLKSLGLKGPELNLGVEKSGVEIFLNPLQNHKLQVHSGHQNNSLISQIFLDHQKMTSINFVLKASPKVIWNAKT